MNPKLSIVIPCYNSENTINKAVNSIIDENRTDYEIVLVDDGSTDGTAKICDDLSNKNEVIKVIHIDNGGLMHAWKTGVLISSGNYVAFCDSDDYLENGYVDYVVEKTDETGIDILTYGLCLEYPNGDLVRQKNRLKSGLYNEDDINVVILPYLYSDGTMESELILKTRCNKVIRRDLILEIMDVLPDDISLGEDDITSFSLIVNARSIMCVQDYCPYHYIRTEQSMIGSYDADVYKKINKLYQVWFSLANRYNYNYLDQIWSDKLSIYIVFTKKEICKNPNGFFDIRRRISTVRESEEFNQIIAHSSYKKYHFAEKVFAFLFDKKAYFLLIYITRICGAIQGHRL